jgi:hypothetical protein
MKAYFQNFLNKNYLKGLDERPEQSADALVTTE